jgi:hypothetical protein
VIQLSGSTGWAKGLKNAGGSASRRKTRGVRERDLLELPNFTMDKELAEFLGFELAKIVVDECFIPSQAAAA